MTNLNDNVEIKGVISTNGTSELTITLNEIFLDNQWRKFNPYKTLTVATTDYDAEFSASELEAIKALVADNKANKSYSQDQLQAINSIVAKLTV
jgi:hypothetical protein